MPAINSLLPSKELQNFPVPPPLLCNNTTNLGLLEGTLQSSWQEEVVQSHMLVYMSDSMHWR